MTPGPRSQTFSRSRVARALFVVGVGGVDIGLAVAAHQRLISVYQHAVARCTNGMGASSGVSGTLIYFGFLAGLAVVVIPPLYSLFVSRSVKWLVGVHVYFAVGLLALYLVAQQLVDTAICPAP